MSSHCYRTTTVEYYEFLVPDTHESMFWPLNAAENYLIVPVEETEFIYNMAQYHQRPTIFEYRQQDEPQCHHSLPNPDNDHEQEQEQIENTVDQLENREPSPSSSQSKCKQKHVYQAEEGYLVEEPTSEPSEEDQDNNS